MPPRDTLPLSPCPPPRSAHPYEVAEVVAVPVAQGNPPYLRWVWDSVPP